jgi:HK97 family phage prohead protease
MRRQGRSNLWRCWASQSFRTAGRRSAGGKWAQRLRASVTMDLPLWMQLATGHKFEGDVRMQRKIASVLREVADRTVRFVLSDGSVDRMGDTVAVAGWDLSSYRRNPVVLFAHDSSSPPIGRATRVWSDGTRLLGDVEFALAETYAFADTIYRLVKGGFLKSGSVGFLPTDYDFAGSGVSYRRQELLEFSVVPVPANANALVEARMKGILSIRDAHRLRRAAEDSPMPPGAIGNCGRPADQECGLKNSAECAIHRKAGGWDGGDGGTGDWDGREADLRIWRARKARLDAPVRMQPEPARPEPDLSTPAARLRHVQALRQRYGLVKRVDPRIVAADCQFRFLRW